MSLTAGVAAASPADRSGSPAKAWLRALEMTAPIAHHPERIFPTVIEELAEEFGEAPALLSDRACLTYGGLAERSNRYARWALDQNVDIGDVVCLMMSSCPEYMAIWLGITRAGGIVALINTSLTGPSLAHCVKIAASKHVIAGEEFVDSLNAALPDLASMTKVWVHGPGRDKLPRIDYAIEQHSGEELGNPERRRVTIDHCALYIYTSGTTGLPKAAKVSHGRLMQWSHWFAGLMDTRPSDRLYNCLPMYHSVGGVLATGAVLIAGGSVVIRENFSASQFWDDVIRWNCTLFQYIGELCRYLLRTAHHPLETKHRIRICCGNGLRPDVWNDFKTRFRIPQILEFYAATEGVVSMFNIEGMPGSIGRIPPYLAHRFPVKLVQFDIETDEPVRNDDGFCTRCAPNEVGEAIGRLLEDSSNVSSRFEGYTSAVASGKKILRNVFYPGDAWFRTGDLMRQDVKGYFYFVDRIGDTFRWKGENVSTSEVSEAICAFPGIKQASVYGVPVPGADGRAGMAMLAADDELDLVAFRTHLMNRLPDYAHPLFLRIRNDIDVTATFKYTKNVFVRQGYDPVATGDVIYFNHRERRTFVRLDKKLYDRIQLCQVRL